MSQQKLEAVFTKEQFLASQQFTGIQKDVLAVALEDNESYTKEEATELLNNYSIKVVG